MPVNEPDLRSLIAWIDQKANYYGDWRGGVMGAILGASGGVMGGLIGILAGGANLDPSSHPWVVVGPLLGWGVISAVTLRWYFKNRNERQKLAAKTYAESRGYFHKLLWARYAGNIKGFLGEDRAIKLNEAAMQWHRCKSALDSTGWEAVESDSVYADTKRKIQSAMDIGMAQLLLLFGSGTAANDAEVLEIVEVMTQSAEEAARTAEKLSLAKGDHGAASELRSALEQVRQLNAAHEEFEEQHVELRSRL